MSEEERLELLKVWDLLQEVKLEMGKLGEEQQKNIYEALEIIDSLTDEENV